MWQQLSRKYIFHHPRLKLAEDIVKLPSGDIVPYLVFVHTPHSVTIICERHGKFLIQKEYSYPVKNWIYQFPGGKVEPNETPVIAAHRELAEESGFIAEDMEAIGWYYPNNRRTAAKMHVFVATHLSSTAKIGGDREEDISSEWVTHERLSTLISSGNITNFSLLAAWTLLQARIKKS